MGSECNSGKVRGCPITVAIGIIGGKWKIPTLYILRNGTLRFSELKRELPKVTQKMLTQQLRELEADGMINRKVYAQVPPKVEYSLTPMAKKLEPILDLLCKWSRECAMEPGEVDKCCDTETTSSAA